MNMKANVFLWLVTSVALFCVVFPQMSLAGPDDGLVLYYSFDGNARDALGKRSGIVHGACLVEDRHGEQSGAYLFDGKDDWIELGEGECLFPFDRDWSVNFWANRDKTGKYKVFFGGADGGIRTKQIVMGAHYVKLTSRADTEADWRINFTELPEDTWHMYTVTWSKEGELISYVDGLLYGMDTVGALQDFCPQYAPIIGGVNFVRRTQYFKGMIDDFRVYDRTLSAADILVLQRSR